MINPQQIEGPANKRYDIGLCYAIIPAGVDRDAYVADCKRRGRITVLIEEGSSADMVFDCPVGLSILDQIEFPDETGKLGSQLVYNNIFVHNKPIIIDRVLKNDEALTLSENEFRIERYTDNGSVSVSGSAKNGDLYINVQGKAENGGKLYVDVGNSENNGGIVVNLKGNFQMELQSMVINAIKGIVKVAVEDININSTEGRINLGNIGEEELEPVLKGTKTVEELEKDVQALTDLLQSITDIVPANVPANSPDPTWATWKSVVATITQRTDLSEVKSEKTFTE